MQASIAEEAGEKLVTRRMKNRDKHGRQQLPEHLERIEIEHDLERQGLPGLRPRAMPDRRRSSASNWSTSRPASRSSGTFATSTPCQVRPRRLQPEHQAAKSPAAHREGPAGAESVGLRASKLGDHLPLYRLERIFERHRCTSPAARCAPGCDAAGELVSAAGGADDRTHSPVAGDSHRRHAGAHSIAGPKTMP